MIRDITPIDQEVELHGDILKYTDRMSCGIKCAGPSPHLLYCIFFLDSPVQSEAETRLSTIAKESEKRPLKSPLETRTDLRGAQNTQPLKHTDYSPKCRRPLWSPVSLIALRAALVSLRQA